MKLGFTFIGELDSGKFATEVARRKACMMLGGALLKQSGHLVDGKPNLMASPPERDGVMISLQCTFKGVQPEFLQEMNAYLQEVIQVMNSMDKNKLESA